MLRRVWTAIAIVVLAATGLTNCALGAASVGGGKGIGHGKGGTSSGDSGGTTGGPTTATTTGRVYFVPTTIDMTGRTDVTSAILNFIATVPDNSTIQFPFAATYQVNGTLELDKRNGLIMDGGGSTFLTNVAGAGDRSHWRFFNGSNLELRNMTIHGANPYGGTSSAFNSSKQWQHGVDVRGVSGFSVHNVTVIDVYGDCFYFGIGSYSTWASNAHVHSNTCLRNGRQGFAVTSGRNIEVDHNTLGAISLMTFYLEPNGTTGGADTIYIHDNQVGMGPRQQALGLSPNGPISNVTFTSNTLRKKALTVYAPAVSGQRPHNITITNNTSDTGAYENNGTAMDLWNIDGLTVTGNYVPLSGTNMAVVDLTGGCGSTVSGNTYPGGVTEVRNISPTC